VFERGGSTNQTQIASGVPDNHIVNAWHWTFRVLSTQSMNFVSVIRHCVCADYPTTDISMARRPATHFSDSYAPRGLALAERRLAHLAELYDSGRWRRYHADAAFLLMVREAKDAVESWRRLINAEPADASAVASPIAVGGDSATLVPLAVSVTCDAARTSLQQDDPADADWRVRGTWLPPVAFSAHGVGTEGDLAEA
jgi:hypothetical protein